MKQDYVLNTWIDGYQGYSKVSRVKYLFYIEG